MHDLTALQVQRFDLVVELFDRLDVSTDEVLDIAEFVLGDAAEAEDDAHGPVWTPALGSATFEDRRWATHGGYDEVNDNDTVDQPLSSKAWVDALLADHAEAAAQSEAARLDRQAALRRHPSFRSAAQADMSDHYGVPLIAPLPSGRFDDVEVAAWLRDLDYSALSDAVYAADEETLDVLDPDSDAVFVKSIDWAVDLSLPEFHFDGQYDGYGETGSGGQQYCRLADDDIAELGEFKPVETDEPAFIHWTDGNPLTCASYDHHHANVGFYHYGSINPSDFKPVVR